MFKCLKGRCGTRKRRSSSRSSNRIVGGPPIRRTKNARSMHDPYPTGAHVNFKPRRKKTKSARGVKRRSSSRSNNRSK